MPTARAIGVTVALGALLACAGGERAALERNKAIVRRNAEAINSRDLAGIDSTMAVNLVRHSQATPEVDVRSVDDFKAFLKTDWAAVPDSRIELSHLVAEGDFVAAWGTYAGTQEGQMGPFPATGNRMSLDIAALFRIENGRIAEIWVTWDNLAALAQLGLMPPPPAAQ
jgi:steroid delta-isomerase-like uncharacterized protein